MKEPRDDNNYMHVLKYTWLFGGIQGLVILIGLVRNKAMALLIGVSGMGFNALMVSVQNFASQCTNLGLSFGAVPRLSELYEQGRQDKIDYSIRVIRLWSLIAALLGLLFSVAISPLVNNFSFTWGDHTLHYAMLGVAVASMAIASGETAILKATRRLGSLARIQVYSALAGVVVSIPLFFLFGHGGVVPAIVLTAFSAMLVTLSFSLRFHPLQLLVERRMLYDGIGMVKLGLAFILAAAVGSGAEMAIRSFLNVMGDMEHVGLYNAAYMITITYAGMVFTAMETDYYPRLSAVSKDIGATNETVNKQTEVSLLLLSPMLVALLMMLPLLIPLLFSREFLPVVAMAQVAVLAMYFKVLTLPVAYITLARGRSLSFFFLESAYFVVLVLSVAAGYLWGGIYGTGVGIVAAHVFDYLMINGYAYLYYGYRSTRPIALYALVQMLIGMAAFVVSLVADGWLYWTAEAALTIASTAYSLFVLRQKAHLWEALLRKLRVRQ